MGKLKEGKTELSSPPLCYLQLQQNMCTNCDNVDTFLLRNRGGGGGLTQFYRAVAKLTSCEKLKVLICQNRKGKKNSEL